jgi:pimeloyl-ACP methyl ester carboxylesterase
MVAMEVKDHFVRVPQGVIYTKYWKPQRSEASSPVILFHDSIGCVEMWHQFPEALAARLGRTVIAYDRLGFGRSSSRRDSPSVRFVFEEAEIWFPLILRQLQVRQFIAFGHSIGGGMAVAAAARLPDLCRAVITEAAQAFVEPQTLHSIATAKLRFGVPKELAKLERYHGEKARWVLSAWTDTWLSPEFRDWNLRSELPRVKCPLLAIHGDRDEYGSAAFPEALSSLCGGPAERVILAGCGHIPHRELEGRVLAVVEEFIARNI